MAGRAATLNPRAHLFTVIVEPAVTGNSNFRVGYNGETTGSELGALIASLPAWGNRPILLVTSTPVAVSTTDALADVLRSPVVAVGPPGHFYGPTGLRLRVRDDWQLRWPVSADGQRRVVSLGAQDPSDTNHAALTAALADPPVGLVGQHGVPSLGGLADPPVGLVGQPTVPL